MTRADQPRLLITGASSGIGLEASRRLVLDGYHLTLLCRTPQRCRETSDRLEDDGADPDNLDVLPMDLADLEDVERSCQQLLERGHRFLVIESMRLGYLPWWVKVFGYLLCSFFLRIIRSLF